MASWGDVVAAITAAGTSSGLNQDAINAAIAVSQSEGGATSSPGDNGTSFGPFQFHIGGQLDGFARWLGGSTFASWLQGSKSPAEQAALNPSSAANYALQQGGYLYNALVAGQAKGLKGADLAYYASQVGQVSEFPQNAANAFMTLFGGGQTVTVAPPVTVTTQNPPIKPIVVTGQVVNKDPLTEIASAAAALASLPGVIAGGINDAVRLGQWLGQPHIVLRVTLGLIGIILIMLGLGLFGFSFVPRDVQKAATTAAKAVAA